MARKRPTKAEQTAKRDQAKYDAWRFFYPKLEAVQSFEEAMELASTRPHHNDPGRSFYSNLDFFLATFRCPSGSNSSERSEYLRIARKLDEEGNLKEGALKEIEEDFRNADERRW